MFNDEAIPMLVRLGVSLEEDARDWGVRRLREPIVPGKHNDQLPDAAISVLLKVLEIALDGGENKDRERVRSAFRKTAGGHEEL